MAFQIFLGKRQVDAQILRKNILGRHCIGTTHLDLHIQPSGAQDSRIDEILAIAGPDHNHISESFHAVDLREKLRDDGRFDIGRDPCASRSEERIHFVEEHDNRVPVIRLLFGFLKDLPDLALGFPDVFVEELGTLDVQEEAPDILPGQMPQLLGDRVRHRLCPRRSTSPLLLRSRSRKRKRLSRARVRPFPRRQP